MSAAPPVVRWAIKYGDNPGYIDHLSLSFTRQEAWKGFEHDYRNSVPGYAKRMRRRGEVKAVRVEIREVE